MPWDGAGSLFAVGIRLTKLGADGTPVVGAGNMYTSTALVQLNGGLNYQDGEEVSVPGGTGGNCMYYRASDTVVSGAIDSMRICTPDPYIMQFCIGGTVLLTETEPTGYQAPAINTDPTPNGVGVELWTRGMLNNAYVTTLPYIHWVFPRAFLRLAENFEASAANFLTPTFSGTAQENDNFGDGPIGDIDFPTDRVWQYNRVATVPTLTGGIGTVIADA
jgi:hypothetical protein